jgi:hypothetical protein
MTSSTLLPVAGDARPVLSVRVGVTGHRDLAGADLPALRASVDAVLAAIESAVRIVAHKVAAHGLYADEPPVLRLVSSLAEGADRLVAAAALARRPKEEFWRLAAPLPFPTELYRKDFPASAEFEHLLAAAGDEAVELDGRPDDDDTKTAAYLEAGRFMLRHADLVIAIHDPAHADKPAGTAAMMREAEAIGLPLLVIAATPPHAVRLGVRRDPVDDLPDWMRATLQALLVPVWPKAKRVNDRAARQYLTGQGGVFTASPQPGVFATRPLALGRFFPWMVGLLAGEQPRAPPPLLPPLPPHPSADTLRLHHLRADALASRYASIHRSGFVAIYLLAAMSLIAAAAAQWLHGQAASIYATSVELATLLAVLWVVWRENALRWRERWLDYRLLAEELRQADLLVRLGRSPPHSAIARVAEEQPENAWVCWLVRAILRSVGPVGGRYDRDYLAAIRDHLAEGRLPEQIDYHTRTHDRNDAANARLRWINRILFALTFAAVLIELSGWVEGCGAPGFFAVAFPALASAGFGIRNQAEFELVVGRSHRLRRRLTRVAAEIAALTGDALTSVALGKAALRAANVMRADTADWATIFEVKESETP